MSRKTKNIELDILTFTLILNLNNNWEEYKKNNKYEVRDARVKK
ncbi:hypothetical protein [Clostridium estertheticum]|nr:hypothetical protein [Clostridium estertheticum]